MKAFSSLEIHSVLVFVTTGSVRYDAGETESESGHTRLATGDPVFQLYQAVRGARNTQGQLLAEPFLQLPSRKEYPDYYQQIKHPISLQKIRYQHIMSEN